MQECARLGAQAPELKAELLANLGAVMASEREPRIYHFDEACRQTLYLDIGRRNGREAYMFFRYCADAPTQWLIVQMGSGLPDHAACVEAISRLLRSGGA